MHVTRNVHFQIKSGKNAEFNRVIQNDVLPLLKQQKGFKDEIVLVNSDRGLGISVWEDRSSAETYQTATFPTVLQKLTPLIEGTPRVETYDVAVTTYPR